MLTSNNLSCDQKYNRSRKTVSIGYSKKIHMSYLLIYFLLCVLTNGKETTSGRGTKTYVESINKQQKKNQGYSESSESSDQNQKQVLGDYDDDYSKDDNVFEPEQYEYDDEYYDDDDDIVNPCQLFWSCMNDKFRTAAKNLGYTRRTWDSKIDFYDGIDWADITEAQQGNATILGYEQDTWDNEPNFCKSWGGLDEETRRLARLMGFGRNTWNFDCAEES